MKVFNEKLDIIGIHCNKCGKSCAITIGPATDPEIKYLGLIETAVTGDSYSSFLEEENRYTFSLCEECVSLMFSSFKIPPKIFQNIIPFNGLVANEKEMSKIYDILIDMQQNHKVPILNAQDYGKLAASNINNSLTLILTWSFAKNKLELINQMEKIRVRYHTNNK